MKATTIKLDGELLEELEAAKPATQSVTAYVREVIRSDIKRLKLEEAAGDYLVFLEKNPDERTWLDEWDSADLSQAPRGKRK